MDKPSKVRLFDYDKADVYYIGFVILLSLWLFIPGFRSGQMLLPFSNDLYLDYSSGIDVQPRDYYPVGSDANLEFQPWNDYACERIKAGEMPFWNPYNLCGTPFYANSLNQLTYIPRLIFSKVLPSENVITALAMLHFLIAGLGFYYFLKAFGISPIAASASGLIILFKFAHPTILMMPPQALTLAFVPLCLLLTIKLIRGGRWLYSLLLAVLLSCCISSGYPVFLAHFIYLGIALVIYEFIRTAQGTCKTAQQGVIRIIVAVLAACLFSLVQILPLMQFVSLAARPSMFQQGPVNFGVSLMVIPLMIFPNLLFSNIFLGVIPFLVFLPIYGQCKIKNEYRFFLITSIIFLLPCISTTIFGAAMKLLPGFGLSPVPPFPALFFCIAICFGFSLNHILAVSADRKIIRVALCLMAIILLLLPLVVHKIIGSSQIISADFVLYAFSIIAVSLVIAFRPSKQVIIGWTVISLLLITFLIPMRRWVSFFPAPNQTGSINELSPTRYFNASGSPFLSPNTNIYNHLRIAQGYDSLILRHYAETYKKDFPDSVKRDRRLASAELSGQPDFLKDAGIGEVIKPRLAKEITAYPESSASGGTCEIVSREPEKIIIKVDAQEKSDLTVSEVFYPAWKYRLNGTGQLMPVSHTGSGFMLIPDIPPGDTTVELRYVPSLERLGLAISAISFIFASGLILWLDTRNRNV